MQKKKFVRLLRNGQITLPKEFREVIGLSPDALIELSMDDERPGVLLITPVAPTSKGSPWLKELYDVFAPVRDSYAKSGMSDAEINADLDAALREARAEQRPKRRKAS